MSEVVMDVKGIMSKLPHRYPFQLVDRILEVEPLKRIKALKNVTNNEPYFIGHFPGEPIMPGVLQIEALAQAGGILLHYSYNLEEGQIILFRGVEDAKFKRPVVPGDQLILTADILSIHRGLCRMKTIASVDGRPVTVATMTCYFQVPQGAPEIKNDCNNEKG